MFAAAHPQTEYWGFDFNPTSSAREFAAGTSGSFMTRLQTRRSAYMGKPPADQLATDIAAAIRGVLQHFIQKGAYSPLGLLSLKSAWEGATFAESNIAGARTYFDLNAMHSHMMERIPAVGLICEFGVWKGRTINLFARKLAALGQSRKLYGFDSFEGFSEEWTGSPVAMKAFDQQGRMPAVPDNVELIKGFVEDTLAAFLERPDINGQPVAFLHIDTDTYSPAKVALELSCNRFCPGTIVLFDEFYGYPGWKQHEYRALLETAEAHGFTYQFIGFSHRAAAIRIETVPT